MLPFLKYAHTTQLYETESCVPVLMKTPVLMLQSMDCHCHYDHSVLCHPGQLLHHFGCALYHGCTLYISVCQTERLRITGNQHVSLHYKHSTVEERRIMSKFYQCMGQEWPSLSSRGYLPNHTVRYICSVLPRNSLRKVH